MNWQSPFSAFSPRVSSTTIDSPASSDSSPEQKPVLAGGRRGSLSVSPGSDSDVPLSRTHQYKKITKPLLERKRRARINKCLDELKEIMTVALQAEGENVSKLEKADILELTVRHLHKLSQSRRLMVRNPMEFQAGYSSCAKDAATFLLSNPGVDVRLSQRLLSHLSSSAGPSMAAHLTAPPSYPHIQPPTSNSMARKVSPPPSPPSLPPAAMINQYNTPRRSLSGHSDSGPAGRSCQSYPPPPPPYHDKGPNYAQVEIKKELPDTSGDSPPPLTVTQGSFTLSIRRQSSPEPLAERTQNEKSVPIRPSAIRLNPTKSEAMEPVWRPYSST